MWSSPKETPREARLFSMSFAQPVTLWLYIITKSQGDSKNAAAPTLGGVVGTVAGERTNFPYSKAMKGSGITWTDKHLFLYLANPGKHIPGNKMSFAGLPGEADRANLIAYLKQN